jgi:hypothetical protein
MKIMLRFNKSIIIKTKREFLKIARIQAKRMFKATIKVIKEVHPI